MVENCAVLDLSCRGPRGISTSFADKSFIKISVLLSTSDVYKQPMHDDCVICVALSSC